MSDYGVGKHPSLFQSRLTLTFDKDETDDAWMEKALRHTGKNGVPEVYVYRYLRADLEHCQIQITGVIYHTGSLLPMLNHLTRVMRCLEDARLAFIVVDERRYLQFRGWRKATKEERHGIIIPANKELNKELTSPYASDELNEGKYQKAQPLKQWAIRESINSTGELKCLRQERYNKKTNRHPSTYTEERITGTMEFNDKLINVFPQMVALKLEANDVKFNFTETDDPTKPLCTYTGWKPL